MKRIILLITFLIFTGTVSAQSITVNAPPQVEINDIFAVDVDVDVNGIMGVYFDLTYDSTILQGLTVGEGNIMKQCSQRVHGISPSIDNSLGKVHFDDTCLKSTITGSGTVAVIKFKAISPRTTDIVLQTVFMSNLNGDPMDSIDINNGRVIVESKSNKGLSDDANRTNSDKSSRTPSESLSPLPTEIPPEEESLDDNKDKLIVLTNTANTQTEYKEKRENKTINQTTNKTLNATKDASLSSSVNTSKEQNMEISPQVTNASSKIQESKRQNTCLNQWLLIILISVFIILLIVKKLKK
ncbi:MAG: hypothetical protein A7315_03930 [Candidatus Altiarchaeales archaeon WOR_SM1_79]|nr:MAG: hypothetical protein A7315_03930 [Candidatus Altiarchaeales archaeon WOR_SM1_79]